MQRWHDGTMRADRFARRRAASRCHNGFTIIEVAVTTTVIAILLTILLPSLSRSRRIANQTACLSGLRQIGVAITSYAFDNKGHIPYGPKAPPPSATNFYPLTGNVTSLVSLQSGAPVGLGLLLGDHLGETKDVLFCPGVDVKEDVAAALAKVGTSQVEGSYYYRHASVAALSGKLPPPRVRLDQLGKNRNGKPLRCLAMDTQFLAPPKMALFNVKTRTHHQRQVVDALFTDGHAATFDNSRERFIVNISVSVYKTLDAILKNFEALDAE